MGDSLNNKRRHRTHIIAEMACSHEGDERLAHQIIDAAGAAGADSIQFQVWSLPEMVVPHHADYPLLQRLELARQTWKELADYVRQRFPQMQIIACVYEASSVAFCEQLPVDAYKIHSADLSNPQLLSCVAATGRRIDLSVGASTLDEIRSALVAIEAGRTDRDSHNVWLMYGYQNFPTPIDAINLDFLMKLRRLFELPVGYQDHSDANAGAAFWLPAAAVGMGVDIIEKHLTHDRSFKGVDHEAALNPDEFVRFVEMIREIDAAKGVATPRDFSPEEIRYRKYSKKSLVAARELEAGSEIHAEDLMVRRAATLGLPPDQLPQLLGKKTRHTIPVYEIVTEEDVS
jgi:sialic acid synthase SpsE